MRLWSALLLTYCAVLLTACGDDKVGGPISVRIPIDDGQGNYKLTTVELTTVTNLEAMEGTSAVIKTRGSLKNICDSSLADCRSYFNEGFKPKARFLKSSGVYIPADGESLLMTTTMAQFERLRKFYDNLGVTGGVAFPQKVFVQTAIVYDNGFSQKTPKNVAFYNSLLDFFVFNQSDSDSISVATNTGVLAHEFTHSIFNSLTKDFLGDALEESSFSADDWEKLPLRGESGELSKKMSNQCASLSFSLAESFNFQPKHLKKSNLFFLMAVNEAIADYFGYEFSRNPDYISPTLKKEKYQDIELRSLEFVKRLECNDVGQIQWTNALAHRIKSRESMRATSHEFDVHDVGTFYSRFLYLIAKHRNLKGIPNTTPQEVLKAIPLIAEKWANKVRTNRPFSYLDLIKAYFEASGLTPKPEVCKAALEVFPLSEYVREKCVR